MAPHLTGGKPRSSECLLNQAGPITMLSQPLLRMTLQVGITVPTLEVRDLVVDLAGSP